MCVRVCGPLNTPTHNLNQKWITINSVLNFQTLWSFVNLEELVPFGLDPSVPPSRHRERPHATFSMGHGDRLKVSLWKEGSQGSLLITGRQDLAGRRKSRGFLLQAVALLLLAAKHSVSLAGLIRLGVDGSGLKRLTAHEYENQRDTSAGRER